MKNLYITLQRTNNTDKICKTKIDYQYRLSISCKQESVTNRIVCIQPPIYSEPSEYTEIKIEKLNPGDSLEIELCYRFLCGGRHVFYMWEKNNQLPTLTRYVEAVSGAGYYSGNTHSHSTYSDGKSTLYENRSVMMENGHSFIYATDHNTDAHFQELKEYEKCGEEDLFLHMCGWEYTTSHGHSIAYGSRNIYDTKRITGFGNLNEWQGFVDAMRQEQALVFLAHPYEAPKYEFGDEVLMNIQGITGIEAWNGWTKDAFCYETRKAFQLWDALNRKGTAHYVGNAVSDAHTSGSQSSPFIKGYLEDLNKETVEEMLKKGSFTGSNGPEIEFSIGETGIGESYVSDDQEALLQLKAFDPVGNIEAVHIYAGRVDGDNSGKANTKRIFTYYPLGESEKRCFTQKMYLKVKPGEFYRAEVITRFGVVAYMADKNKYEKGYAFTNPVWIQ